MYGEKPRQRKSLHYGTRPISNYKSRGKKRQRYYYIIDDKDT